MKLTYVEGEVIKGFGRGSKELGIPTANFSDEIVSKLPADFETGIYFGWAKLGDGPIHKMVVSIGWNPFYKNEKKSMETHVIHKFENEFYGQWMKTIICGFIRPETNFTSLESLIEAINDDIRQAKEKLEQEEFIKVKEDNFFTAAPKKS